MSFYLHYLPEKEKRIQKERRSIKESGLKIKCFLGTDASDSDWNSMYNFYMITSQKKWGRAYLNKIFFDKLRRTMSKKILFIMAKKNNRNRRRISKFKCI